MSCRHALLLLRGELFANFSFRPPAVFAAPEVTRSAQEASLPACYRLRYVFASSPSAYYRPNRLPTAFSQNLALIAAVAVMPTVNGVEERVAPPVAPGIRWVTYRDEQH
jgi:hypothetical protein